jgi:hypothetical protein
MIYRRTLPAIAALAISACDPLGTDLPGDDYHPGTIEFYGDTAMILTPVVAEPGVPFPVRVTTFGGGCTQKGITRSETNDLIGELRPFDITTRDVACPDILKTFTHEAIFTIDRPGIATIRVHGRAEPGEEPVVKLRRIRIERRVLVDAGAPLL